MFLIGLFISAVIFAALGALGGIIGASLFGKKAKGATLAPQNPSNRQP
jgi:hypothetical protein